MRAGADRLVAIDVLRGIAALAVLLTHLPFSLNLAPVRAEELIRPDAVPDPIVAVTEFGRFGVNLFLVISGFCIHLRWARAGDLRAGSDFLAFWRRRLVRLYPPYLVALLATVGGLVAAFGLLGHPTTIAGLFGYPSLGDLALDLALLVLLLQNFTGASYGVGNGSFWTLALEEQLYLLYFPFLWLRRRAGWTTTLLIAIAVTVAWRAVPLAVGGVFPEWLLLGPSRWIEWVLGALAVEAYFGRVHLPWWCSSPVAAGALLSLAVAANTRGVSAAAPAVTLASDALFGLAFFVLVNWLGAVERAGSLSRGPVIRWLRWTGLVSYSLYLTHTPVVVAAKQVALRAGVAPVGAGVLVILAVRAVAAIAIAAVFHRYVEAPAIRASRTLRTRAAA